MPTQPENKPPYGTPVFAKPPTMGVNPKLVDNRRLIELHETLEKHALPPLPKQDIVSVDSGLLNSFETLIGYTQQVGIPPILIATLNEANALLVCLKQARDTKFLVKFE